MLLFYKINVDELIGTVLTEFSEFLVSLNGGANLRISSNTFDMLLKLKK